MEKLHILNRIKTLYDEGGNVIQYLRGLDGKTADDHNAKYDILISYDFQAGTYSRGYNRNRVMQFTQRPADIINGLNCRKDSIFEAGVGEATTMVSLLNHDGMNFKRAYGADISWSRIKYAQKFVTTQGGGNKLQSLSLRGRYVQPAIAR